MTGMDDSTRAALGELGPEASDSHNSMTQIFADDPVSSRLATIIHDLEPGARLPSERLLAEKLQVSRNAIRDRIGVLEGLGALARRKGSGTYVESLKPDSLAFALNLAISSSHLPLSSLESVRIALERQAAAEATEAADPVLIAYMRSALNSMASTDDSMEILEADRAFHQSLLRAAGNPALIFFADALAGVLVQGMKDRSDRSVARVSKEALIGKHEDIYEAVVSGRQEAAMAAIDEHFKALPQQAS
ncbi:transcriptional regulator, GntR family [Brevibacterium siliguriense]|uniref:Transcriptional regulator, GntR family n=2 Tax=Brevibacterium siliguriense TaxID=1136497 RepID=A0A1H1QBE8_9MICO|nr:transcriptional regulator, GntR family [Brevibacterium siliguriense]